MGGISCLFQVLLLVEYCFLARPAVLGIVASPVRLHGITACVQLVSQPCRLDMGGISCMLPGLFIVFGIAVVLSDVFRRDHNVMTHNEKPAKLLQADAVSLFQPGSIIEGAIEVIPNELLDREEDGGNGFKDGWDPTMTMSDHSAGLARATARQRLLTNMEHLDLPEAIGILPYMTFSK
ncbi:hypothetical protein B0H17DRAFT_1132652 [Mycena rosella]|uniref:Uncharacterized protein n=1 Tax=Mycena rosella TaxID=1033263 RepID=A0AAD7DKT4_MYCRO|nr:hypothetical protein B0H17DRAFT_1132652 [Mycena rosella]